MDPTVAADLRAAAGRITPAVWRLQALLGALPEGRTHDVVEQALIALDHTAAALEAEAKVIG